MGEPKLSDAKVLSLLEVEVVYFRLVVDLLYILKKKLRNISQIFCSCTLYMKARNQEIPRSFSRIFYLSNQDPKGSRKKNIF